MMARLLDHIWRKLKAHVDEWADLPTVTIPSAAITDQQTAQWSHEMYARDLANEPHWDTDEVAS